MAFFWGITKPTNAAMLSIKAEKRQVLCWGLVLIQSVPLKVRVGLFNKVPVVYTFKTNIIKLVSLPRLVESGGAAEAEAVGGTVRSAAGHRQRGREHHPGRGG